MWASTGAATHLLRKLSSIGTKPERMTCKAIALQEEIDWECYGLYGLLPAEGQTGQITYDRPIEVALGERAFEIVFGPSNGRRQNSAAWFKRHGSTPVTEIPAHSPEDYRQVVKRRIELIERDRTIGLIERPEYKRRWNSPAWDDVERTALREWLLDRLEAPHLWPTSDERPPQLTTVIRLADAVRAGTRLHADRWAICRLLWIRPHPSRDRASRWRVGAFSARSSLLRRRPSKARAVGKHLALQRLAAAKTWARSLCRRSSRIRTS